MLKFIQWKAKRFIQIFRREGWLRVITFLFERTLNKVIAFFKALERPYRDSQSRSEFLTLWRSSQTQNKTFRVLLVVSSFFELDGQDFMQGGAERYTFEIHKIISELGGQLEVYQCGTSNWMRQQNGVFFYGLNTNGFRFDNLNSAFHKWVPQGELTIYYQMILSAPFFHTPSICVSHGIDWDAHWLQANHKQYANTIRLVNDSIRNVTRLVSVDTNTINWLRATNVVMASKCSYIPNFVDTAQFYPCNNDHKDLVILYPRRLSEARGFWLLAGIVPVLLEKYPQIKVRFCGKAEPIEQVEVQHLCEVYPQNVTWFDAPPNRMPEVYQDSDLVIIPTCYSEGTSLSCLEALASKCSVIATNVGGLPDLLISGYNGLLIEPEQNALWQAICHLIEDPVLRQTLAENGHATAQAFDISIWRKRWKDLILDTKK